MKKVVALASTLVVAGQAAFAAGNLPPVPTVPEIDAYAGVAALAAVAAIVALVWERSRRSA